MDPRKQLERLAADHRRVERALARIDALAGGARWDAARVAVEELGAALRAHHAFEEAELYPRFDQLPRQPARVTAVLRNEHQAIEEIADQMHAALRAPDREGFRIARGRLLDLFPSHELKEEQLIAPALAHASSAPQR